MEPEDDNTDTKKLAGPSSSALPFTSSAGSYESLTSAEVEGLRSQFNFADGHAYHSPVAGLSQVLNELDAIWDMASALTIPEAETYYKNAFSTLIGSPTLRSHRCFSVLPTASNSIDVVGAWLSLKGLKVGLMEPAFDNLYLMLKRRGVEIKSIDEGCCLDLCRLEHTIDAQGLGAIFIILPNNPTGFNLTEAQFNALCLLCERKGVALIVDKTFRLYAGERFDEYRLLRSSGVPFVLIEDTGKTWATQDLKVSLLTYCESLARELRMLYEEIFLCSSNFTLILLTKMVEQTAALGIAQTITKPVHYRIAKVREVLADSLLNLEGNQYGTRLPLCWINCRKTGFSDLEVTGIFKRYGIALLPGRNFYWDSQSEHTGYVRMSLLRPSTTFWPGLRAIQSVIAQHFMPGCGERQMNLHVAA